MPFENFDSKEAKQEPAPLNLNLIGVQSEQSERGMPTGRLVGLAGVTGGLTELAVDQLGNKTAKLFKESAVGMMDNAIAGGAGYYNSLDKLRVFQATSILDDVHTMSGPLSREVNRQVAKVVSHGLDLDSAFREKAFAHKAVLDSSVDVAAEIRSLQIQLDKLNNGFMSRADARDIMHNDSLVLAYDRAKLNVALEAPELRALGESSFNKGSIIGEKIIERSNLLKPGEKLTAMTVVEEVAPAWKQKLDDLIAVDAKMSRVAAQVEATKNFATADLKDGFGGLLHSRHMDQALFQESDSITSALRKHSANYKYLSDVEQSLAAKQVLVQKHASMLNAELSTTPASLSFVNGFAKGAVVMSAAVGAGYALDKMMGREDLAISSPLGLAIDASAGLALMSKMPMRVKAPIALATLAAPRILDATGYGDILRPSVLQGDSLWRPNAVDAIGLGFAAGLNVDPRVRLGIGAATIVAGRVYNSTQESSEVSFRTLDPSKIKSNILRY